MFKHDLDVDAQLALIEIQHAAALNSLIKNSYVHIREWSHWLKNNEQTVGETEEWVRKNQLNFGSGNGYEIGIWYRGEIAGQIGYNYFDRENHRTEIGYWLGESFQGKGLIIRGCRALIDNAFKNMGFNRIEIKCDTENAKSRRIPEQLGFKLEGIARGSDRLHDSFRDLAVYSILADEWHAPETPIDDGA